MVPLSDDLRHPFFHWCLNPSKGGAWFRPLGYALRWTFGCLNPPKGWRLVSTTSASSPPTGSMCLNPPKGRRLISTTFVEVIKAKKSFLNPPKGWRLVSTSSATRRWLVTSCLNPPKGWRLVSTFHFPPQPRALRPAVSQSPEGVAPGFDVIMGCLAVGPHLMSQSPEGVAPGFFKGESPVGSRSLPVSTPRRGGAWLRYLSSSSLGTN